MRVCFDPQPFTQGLDIRHCCSKWMLSSRAKVTGCFLFAVARSIGDVFFLDCTYEQDERGEGLHPRRVETHHLQGRKRGSPARYLPVPPVAILLQEDDDTLPPLPPANRHQSGRTAFEGSLAEKEGEIEWRVSLFTALTTVPPASNAGPGAASSIYGGRRPSTTTVTPPSEVPSQPESSRV